MTSEDSDSEGVMEHTACNSAVTSGTSSPMPNSSAGPTRRDIAKLTDLEEMIQHYKKKAKVETYIYIYIYSLNGEGLKVSPSARVLWKLYFKSSDCYHSVVCFL